MKKLIITVLALCVGILVNAQKPVEVVSFTSHNYGVDWYKGQIEAWQKEVDKNPKDEWAWRNLYMATHYCDVLSETGKFNEEEIGEPQSPTPAELVLEKMEKAVPESFVYYFCKERDCAEMNEEHLQKAIELIPENIVGNDVSFLACYQWKFQGDERGGKLRDLLWKAYQTGYFPERIMRYNYNMFLGMEPNAIYFGTGDNNLVPGKIMQEVMNFREDITIIPQPYLFLEKGYREKLFKKLGIKPFETPESYYSEKYGLKWPQYYLNDMAMHIIKESHRPAYFFPGVLPSESVDKEKLYNEGLLVKYSEKPYNNFSVAMNNVKNLYHLEYLTEPPLYHSAWTEDKSLEINYVYLLSHLIPKFEAAGDKDEAKKLKVILSNCVANSNYTEEQKETIRIHHNLK